MLKRAFPH